LKSDLNIGDTIYIKGHKNLYLSRVKKKTFGSSTIYAVFCSTEHMMRLYSRHNETDSFSYGYGSYSLNQLLHTKMLLTEKC
jgi:hypothetical protein